MARQPYTSVTYQKDEALLEGIKSCGMTFGGPIDRWTDRWYERAVMLLDARTPRGLLYSDGNRRVTVIDATPPQIRQILEKYVRGAKGRMNRYLAHKSDQLELEKKLFSEKLERDQRLFEARQQGNIETLLGDEAEELGYCGCVPVIRIKQ